MRATVTPPVTASPHVTVERVPRRPSRRPRRIGEQRREVARALEPGAERPV